MNQEQQALIHLAAASALGYVHQWAMFAPKRVPTWIAWAALAVFAGIAYWWSTPTMVADFTANWRLSVLGLVTFFLTAKGTGSSTAAAKAAPKTDSL